MRNKFDCMINYYQKNAGHSQELESCNRIPTPTRILRYCIMQRLTTEVFPSVTLATNMDLLSFDRGIDIVEADLFAE